MAVRHQLHPGPGLLQEEGQHLTSARDNVQYVEAFMVLLEKPTMISEEHKVITEAQDMLRSEK